VSEKGLLKPTSRLDEQQKSRFSVRSSRSGQTEFASRLQSSQQARDEKVWTEAEVLADEDLWRVSDDSDEEGAVKVYTKEGQVSYTYDPNVRNREFYDD
jgi:hypothetical protein